MNLSHHRVILSASYPSEGRDRRYLQVPDSSRRVAEAIIPLASLLIRNGAAVVYGGHPSITRLIAGVVSNFPSPVARFTEAPRERASDVDSHLGKVFLYQSAAFTAIAEVDWLRTSSHVSIYNVPIDPDESKPGCPPSPLSFPKSLRNLRERMFTDVPPTALVCIGGMEGVEEEMRQFAELFPRYPIFLYSSTGGASQLLAERPPSKQATIVDHRPTREKNIFDIAEGWKFSEQEMEELGPYTIAAFEICGALALIK